MKTPQNPVDYTIATIDKIRREHPNAWYYATFKVEGHEIKLKGFSTWLQIFTIDGVDYANSMGESVTELHAYIRQCITYVLET